MRLVTINENDSGQRVDKFLSKFLPAMPKNLLYKQLRNKRVKRDKKALAPQDVVRAGDVLSLYINDEFFEEKPLPQGSRGPLSIVYEDENLLILDKPAGLCSHGGDDSLLGRVQNYLYTTGAYDPKAEHSFAPALSNRLDRNTRGLVLAAKNGPAQRELNKKIKAGEVTKEYLCLVTGGLPKEEDELCHYLASDPKENKVFVTAKDHKGAKEARLRYRVLRREATRSLVAVTLLTGRKHQIRVQFSAIGHPLVGDTKYGAPKDASFAYQALCAYRLSFDFSVPSPVLGALSGKSFSLDEEPESLLGLNERP